MLVDLWQSLVRRKRRVEFESGLARVLSLVDLTALGVGSTLGIGVYVLAGAVAQAQAGPAVTVSFVIAAVASAGAGACYAEFAARVPKAGSAYVYSYVTIGEFVAFTIGWNLVLEYVIGISSVARGLSGYVDTLLGFRMSEVLTNWFPMHVRFLAAYPDFLAFVVVMVVTALLAIGVKESSWLNNICTSANLMTIVIVIVAGALNSNPANWSLPQDRIPDGLGVGGFMPYGVAGVMAGAAKCFFAFVGFDCIATCGEEAIHPQRNIPLSIAISLLIVFLSYFGISTVLTMMVPYYKLSATAPLVDVFEHIGWISIKWIVTIGATFALCTALLGAMFPLPRILYAMSSDGLLYRRLGVINMRTRTPLFATFLSGLLAAVMALLFDLNHLIDMMSIGTLMAYTIVAICVLVLRYQADDDMADVPSTFGEICSTHLFNRATTRHVTKLTSNIAVYGVIAFGIASMVLCALLNIVLALGSGWALDLGLALTGTVLVGIMVIISRQPSVRGVHTVFKVPLVPWIPCLSVLVNVYLMFQLDFETWIRFGVWLVVGYFIYFTYGMRHSIEGAVLECEKEHLLRKMSMLASYGSGHVNESGPQHDE